MSDDSEDATGDPANASGPRDVAPDGSGPRDVGANGAGPRVPERYREWDGPDRRPESPREWLRWGWTVEVGPVMFAREILSSAAFVAAVGLLLFAISGVWPPMVAVSSGSMQPNLQEGDMVFVVEEHRFAGNGAVEGTGIVTYRSAGDGGYSKFGERGDVVVYRPNGAERGSQIIHRARFYVEEGENWYDEANPEYVQADNCDQLANCPAPNSGFITKGDNEATNGQYDQALRMSKPVKPAWIEGKAALRIPLLGRIRLLLSMVAPLVELGRGVAVAAGFAVVSTRLVGR